MAAPLEYSIKVKTGEAQKSLADLGVSITNVDTILNRSFSADRPKAEIDKLVASYSVVSSIAQKAGEAGKSAGDSIAHGAEHAHGAFEKLKHITQEVGQTILGVAGGQAAFAGVQGLEHSIVSLFEAGLAGKKANEEVAIGFRTVGLSAKEAEVGVAKVAKAAKEQSQIFAINEKDLKLATAQYLKMGGSQENLGKTTELIIGLSKRANIEYGQAAKLLAKSTDPEVEAQLGRIGIKFDKTATATERYNIIAGKVGGTLEGMKDAAQSNVGSFEKMENAIAKAKATIGGLLVDAIAPLALGVAGFAGDIAQGVKDVFGFVADHSTAFGVAALGATALAVAMNAAAIAGGIESGVMAAGLAIRTAATGVFGLLTGATAAHAIAQQVATAAEIARSLAIEAEIAAIIGETEAETARAIIVADAAALLGVNITENEAYGASLTQVAIALGENATAETIYAASLAGEIAATEAAVIAQEELNVTMEANPIGAVILVIAGLIAAYVALDAILSKSAKTQLEEAVHHEEFLKEERELVEQKQKTAELTAKQAEEYSKLADIQQHRTPLTVEQQTRLFELQGQVAAQYPELVKSGQTYAEMQEGIAKSGEHARNAIADAGAEMIQLAKEITDSQNLQLKLKVDVNAEEINSNIKDALVGGGIFNKIGNFLTGNTSGAIADTLSKDIVDGFEGAKTAPEVEKAATELIEKLTGSELFKAQDAKTKEILIQQVQAQAKVRTDAIKGEEENQKHLKEEQAKIAAETLQKIVETGEITTEQIDKIANAQEGALGRGRNAINAVFGDIAHASTATAQKIREDAFDESLKKATAEGKLTGEKIGELAAKFGISRDRANELYLEQVKQTTEALKTAEGVHAIGQAYADNVKTTQDAVNQGLDDLGGLEKKVRDLRQSLSKEVDPAVKQGLKTELNAAVEAYNTAFKTAKDNATKQLKDEADLKSRRIKIGLDKPDTKKVAQETVVSFTEDVIGELKKQKELSIAIAHAFTFDPTLQFEGDVKAKIDAQFATANEVYQKSLDKLSKAVEEAAKRAKSGDNVGRTIFQIPDPKDSTKQIQGTADAIRSELLKQHKKTIELLTRQTGAEAALALQGAQLKEIVDQEQLDQKLRLDHLKKFTDEFGKIEASTFALAIKQSEARIAQNKVEAEQREQTLIKSLPQFKNAQKIIENSLASGKISGAEAAESMHQLQQAFIDVGTGSDGEAVVKIFEKLKTKIGEFGFDKTKLTLSTDEIQAIQDAVDDVNKIAVRGALDLEASLKAIREKRKKAVAAEGITTFDELAELEAVGKLRVIFDEELKIAGDSYALKLDAERRFNEAMTKLKDERRKKELDDWKKANEDVLHAVEVSQAPLTEALTRSFRGANFGTTIKHAAAEAGIALKKDFSAKADASIHDFQLAMLRGKDSAEDFQKAMGQFAIATAGSFGEMAASGKNFGDILVQQAFDALERLAPIIAAQILVWALGSPENVATLGIAGPIIAAGITATMIAVIESVRPRELGGDMYPGELYRVNEAGMEKITNHRMSQKYGPLLDSINADNTQEMGSWFVDNFGRLGVGNTVRLVSDAKELMYMREQTMVQKKLVKQNEQLNKQVTDLRVDLKEIKEILYQTKDDKKKSNNDRRQVHSF